MALTEEISREIDTRISEQEVRSWIEKNALKPPKEPQPGSFSHRLMVAQQERARQEREAAAAEQARLQSEREAAEERRRQEWECNAPQRAQAAAELSKVEGELARLDTERERLAGRASQLQEVASR